MSFKEDIYETVKEVAINSDKIVSTHDQEVFFRHGLMVGVNLVLDKLKEIGFIVE